MEPNIRRLKETNARGQIQFYSRTPFAPFNPRYPDAQVWKDIAKAGVPLETTAGVGGNYRKGVYGVFAGGNTSRIANAYLKRAMDGDAFLLTALLSPMTSLGELHPAIYFIGDNLAAAEKKPVLMPFLDNFARKSAQYAGLSVPENFTMRDALNDLLSPQPKYLKSMTKRYRFANWINTRTDGKPSRKQAEIIQGFSDHGGILPSEWAAAFGDYKDVPNQHIVSAGWVDPYGRIGSYPNETFGYGIPGLSIGETNRIDAIPVLKETEKLLTADVTPEELRTFLYFNLPNAAPGKFPITITPELLERLANDHRPMVGADRQRQPGSGLLASGTGVRPDQVGGVGAGGTGPDGPVGTGVLPDDAHVRGSSRGATEVNAPVGGGTPTTPGVGKQDRSFPEVYEIHDGNLQPIPGRTNSIRNPVMGISLWTRKERIVDDKTAAREGLALLVDEISEQLDLYHEVLWDYWAGARSRAIELAEDYPATPEELLLLKQIEEATRPLQKVAREDGEYPQEQLTAFFVPALQLLALWRDEHRSRGRR